MVGSDRDQELEHRPGKEKAEESSKKPAPGEVVAGDCAVAEAASCDYCDGAAAAVYCHADAARLCLLCDRNLHGANELSSRHDRAPLCADCRSAGAVFRRASSGAFLCYNCDVWRHWDDGGEPMRFTVQPYSGCPPASELAGLFGCPSSASSNGANSASL